MAIKEGERLSSVYIVASGEFEMTKRINASERSDFTNFDNEKIRNQIHLVEGKSIAIEILTEGNVFGEEGIFAIDESSQYNIRCQSLKGTLLSVPLNSFAMLSPTSFEFLKKRYFNAKKLFQVNMFQQSVAAMISNLMAQNGNLARTEELGVLARKEKVQEKGLLPYLNKCNEMIKQMESLKKKRSMNCLKSNDSLENINDLLSCNPRQYETKKTNMVAKEGMSRQARLMGNLEKQLTNVKNEIKMKKRLILIRRMSLKDLNPEVK